MRTADTLETPPSSSQIACEIGSLERQVHDAELAAQQSRRTAQDEMADKIRAELEGKKRELTEIQRIESEEAAAHLHQQQLEALRAVESDMVRVKAESLALRAELLRLPEKIAVTEHLLSELLRVRAGIKKDLGFC